MSNMSMDVHKSGIASNADKLANEGRYSEAIKEFKKISNSLHYGKYARRRIEELKGKL